MDELLTADRAARRTLERLERAAAFQDARAVEWQTTFGYTLLARYHAGKADGIRCAIHEVRLWLEGEPAAQPEREGA